MSTFRAVLRVLSSLITMSGYVYALPFGTVARNIFFSVMTILFPHDSVSDRDEELIFLVCIVLVSSFFRHMVSREKNLFSLAAPSVHYLYFFRQMFRNNEVF